MAKKKTDAPHDLANTVLPHSQRTLLYGPPSTGKSWIANAYAKDTGQPIFNITLTEETAGAEIRGHYVPKGGEFVFAPGPGLQAFGAEWKDKDGKKRKGGILALHEVNHASADCLTQLHSLLDDIEIAALTVPTGETFTPGEDYKVIGTMNGAPSDLPDPIRSRFPVQIDVDCAPEAAIERLPEDLRDAARTTAINPDVQRRIDYRAWAQFAKLRTEIDENTAARACFGPRSGDVLDSLKLAGSK